MSSQHSLRFKKELHEAFRYSAWEVTPEHTRQLDELRDLMERNLERHPQLLHAFETACAEGEQARRLAEELNHRLWRDGDNADFRSWFDSIREAITPRIKHHLDIKCHKTLERMASQRKRHTGSAGAFKSSIDSIVVAPGAHHPNSLRHLPAASRWQVLIDETGSRFDDEADELSLSDPTLGRLVALAVPGNIELPPLKDFHAVDAKPAQADKVVRKLLRHRVGVFGFTVQDPAIQATRWLAHVILLARWVLAQLPIVPGKAARVAILIEQNRGYQPKDELRALCELLESEFARLSPTRYAGLQINASFMEKTHPLNGYVDAIAFTWGSPTPASADRLKKTAWLGHCLLRPSDRALERLYLALHAGRELPPAQWYELCAAAATEPDGGLLNEALAQLGKRLQSQPGYWNACLAEVQQRMLRKVFTVHELAQALSWLERWATQGQKLPLAEQLALETARLALDNHRGSIDRDRVGRCIDLAQSLHDEAPADASEAMLRVAVAATNAFEFELMRDTIAQWLEEAIAVPGLLNHAKLHSTLGQIEAFSGNGAAALRRFDAAIAAFGRLSNKEHARREIAQTRHYRLIAALDADSQSEAALKDAFIAHFRALLGKKSVEEISRSLACSGQERRHPHHLWLRAIIQAPALFPGAASAYLELQPQWQGGEDHPWPLIAAYRAWLLKDAGAKDSASAQLSWAIERCLERGNGPTLHWMGAVLHTLAQALGIAVDTSLPTNIVTQLRDSLPAAPHAALADFGDCARAADCPRATLLAALRQCLPFNFH